VWSRNIKNGCSIYIYIYDISRLKVNNLTLILLMWRKWWAPNNASKYQMGFNMGLKGLTASCGIISRQRIIYYSVGFPSGKELALLEMCNKLWSVICDILGLFKQRRMVILATIVVLDPWRHNVHIILLAPTCNRKNADCRILHLLALNRVLIYHRAQNEKYVQCGAFVNAATIVTDP